LVKQATLHDFAIKVGVSCPQLLPQRGSHSSPVLPPLVWYAVCF